jgi:uncharacterized membrane protein
MNGDLIAVLGTVLGTGVVILVPICAGVWKIASIGKVVEGIPNMADHVADHESRLVKIETEHRCCPVCARNGKGKQE